MTMMPAMEDVLRLTRSGRIGEATALLRGGLTGDGAASDARRAPPPAPGAKRGRPARKATPTSDVLDLVPPKTAGRAWTFPAEPREAPSAGGRGRFEWREVANAAGSRRYKLYVPDGAADKPRPLVVMLHGCTQSPDDFAAGTRMNAVADEMGVLVAYPEQRAAHNSSKCWNWFKPGDQRRGAGEASLLAAVVDDVARDLSVDRARVFVAGLSAGGAAAAVLAQEYPDVFRGAGVHSGLACGAARDLPSALAAMKQGAPARPGSRPQVPTIVFHGSADKTVAPANARHILAGSIAGLAAPSVEHGRAPGGAAYTREVWRDGQGARAEAWTIEGAGHAWSGGSASGSYTDPRGPDASRAMIEFFLGL